MKSKWNNLDSDIARSIAKLLSEEDITSFRSVCRQWRFCIPRYFPLRVPSHRSLFSKIPIWYREETEKIQLVVDSRPIYQLHLRGENKDNGGAPDLDVGGAPDLEVGGAKDRDDDIVPKRDGRLYRVWAKPKGKCVFLSLFSSNEIMKLQDPLTIELSKFEVSKISMGLGIYTGDKHGLKVECRRVIVHYILWSPTVVMLNSRGDLYYWRTTDEDWTRVEMKGYGLHDFVLLEGMFYGISTIGQLLKFDLDFHVEEITSVNAPPHRLRFNAPYTIVLVAFKSDIYAVSKPLCFNVGNLHRDYSSGPSGRGILMLHKWGWKERAWLLVTELKNCALIVGDDATFGLSAEDFKCCETWNFVSFVLDGILQSSSKAQAVYDLGKHSLGFLDYEYELEDLFWSIPDWLYLNAAESDNGC